MKFSAVVRYFGGGVDDFTVKVKAIAEAWEKLWKRLSCDCVQSVEMAEILMADREIK